MKKSKILSKLYRKQRRPLRPKHGRRLKRESVWRRRKREKGWSI